MIGTQDKREIDNNGFVEVFDNPISCVGIYQYINTPGAPEQGKVYRVLRSEDELSRQETLDSLRLMPIVDDHPIEPGMLGDNRNAINPERKGIHGVVGEKVYFKDGTIYGNLKIHSSSLLDKIDVQGKRELSAGYWAEYDYTPGIWNGQEYDAIQRNITFNHIALVDSGRMGSSVSVQDTNQQITNLSTNTAEEDMHDPAKLAELKEAIAALAALFQNFLNEEACEIAPVTDSDEEEKDKEKTEDSEEEEKEKTEDSNSCCKAIEDEEPVKDQEVNYNGVKDSIDEAVKNALSRIADRDQLYLELKPHIGVMDAAMMTLDQLAEYANDKLKLKADKGQELASVKGFLAGTKISGTQDKAPDIATNKFNFKDFE